MSGEGPGVTKQIGPLQVSLLRWLRAQLREALPVREHLEAAVQNGDVAEVRRLVARFDLSKQQRHHLEGLLAAWEEALRS